MDWSKAKNVLIILFLLLNGFLAIYLFMFYGIDSSKKNIGNTENILIERGYTLETRIPNIKNGYKLKYENVEFDRNLIAQQLLETQGINDKINENESFQRGSKSLTFLSKNSFVYIDNEPKQIININEKANAEKYVKEVLDKLKLPYIDLYLDAYEFNNDKSITLTFTEKYNKYLIFDNNAKVTVTDKGITSMNCKFVKVKGFETNKIDIIPAYQILLREFLKGSNGVIISIDLGYESFIENATKESSNNPVWRIKLKDGTQRIYKSK